MKFTYLITHAATEGLFDVCKDAINKYTPGDMLTATKNMFQDWGTGFRYLFDNCPTDVGVFIDDDCILSSSIKEPLQAVMDGDVYMAALDGERLGRGIGYYQPNLMIIDIKRFKKEFGSDGINIDIQKYKKDTGRDKGDFFLGISQKLNGKGIIPFYSKTGATILSSDIYFNSKKIATHLWYGAWKHRRNKFVDGINMEVRENDFINNYWNKKI